MEISRKLEGILQTAMFEHVIQAQVSFTQCLATVYGFGSIHHYFQEAPLHFLQPGHPSLYTD